MDARLSEPDDAAQPLLAGEEEGAAEEGRCPSWWETMSSERTIPAAQVSGLSAFARVQGSTPASPAGSGRQSPRSQATSTNTARKGGGKGNSTRESRARRTQWLVINSQGIKTSFVSDKRGLIQKFRLGVPIRDMRLLDPNLLTSETGKILVRDNAIVFSVEHVRLIITADFVIIPQTGFERSSSSMRFAAMLEEAIIEAAQEKQAKVAYEIPLSARDREDDNLFKDFEDQLSDDSSGLRHEAAVLPFELHVLEVAIGDVCAVCTELVKELESSSHPALDALTKHVSTANLERVRKVKTRHQRLYTRVVTVREELQRFLEDDDDMMKMCLTRKKELERMVSSGHGERQASYVGSLPRRSFSINIREERRFATPAPHGGASPRAQEAYEPAGHSDDNDTEESIEVVENLLESYFMQIDSSYDRLVSIGEFIKDTEEYINIELDSSRNRLIRLEIVLTAGTFAVAIFSLVAGILGENLILPPAITKTVWNFLEVNLTTACCCLLFFLSIMAYIRWRRLF
ncbi:g8553 [Coccomyxa elongata]